MAPDVCFCEVPPQRRDRREDLLPAGPNQDPTHGAAANQERDNRHWCGSFQQIPFLKSSSSVIIQCLD